MTDEELIEQLRSEPTWGGLVALTKQAADRIEALTKERDSLLAGHRVLNIGGARLQDRAETAEAKLAKAVEALGRIARQPDYRLPSPQGIAQEALAEIKGKNHE